MMDQADLPALTGARFFAAASIALTHFGFARYYQPYGLHFELAHLGMPLFFSLSGFIMHYVYSGVFSASWGRATGRFAIARFSRLYPLYLALLGYFVVFSPKFAALMSDPAIGFSYLTLTQTWWYWQINGETIGAQPFGLSWSLSTEWFFYFVYAAGLYRAVNVVSVRRLVAALVFMCLFVLALNLVFFVNADAIEAIALRWVSDAVPGRGGNSIFAWLVLASPYFRIWEFLGGVLACQLYLVLRDRPSAGTLGAPLFWWGFLWVAITFLLCSDYFSPHSRLLGVSPRLFGFIGFVAPTFLEAPGLLLMLLGLALGKCAPARFMSLGAIVSGGEISYSLYLGHQFVGSIATLPADFPNATLGLLIQFLIACIIAAGMYKVIELPSKLLLRRAVARLRRPVQLSRRWT